MENGYSMDTFFLLQTRESENHRPFRRVVLAFL